MADHLAELESLRHGTALVDRSDRGFVTVAGPDARSFLQALVSADLDPLGDGDGTASLLLLPQGKLDVAFRLLRVGDELWLDTDPGLAPQLVASLERFKIRVDARIDDRTGSVAMVSHIGADVATPPVALHAHVADPDDPAMRRVRTAFGVDLVGPPDAVRTRADAPVHGGVHAVSPEAWEAFRIEQGVPMQPVDVDAATIPQEAELEHDAVSFTKGCFVGQELVCRIDSRGHVNRFLRRLVAVDGARPAPGAEIVAGDKVVGVVTSVTPDGFPPVALGYVRREVEPPSPVGIRSPGGVATAVAEALRPG